ncbi:zona pellucida sperm-binding protein 1-like [Polypterus senegalus]|uniref:zona pellucida sperm-binding protein 1-like n=1 Tax=Polypterus senegalus TaxID=55291 RepID=UPI00196461DC|nr:zona pellucida sperm-binding protein 1-like [Polypterus senegalus]
MVVNSPALPDLVSSGALGVVLRIAKDDGYTTFFPDTQVPLRYLLGSKIYLEVKIVNPPTPEVVLLVHYCIAYPRSSENVWVLMYNGCPNALDYGTGLHLKDHNWQPVPKHTRHRQFMDAKENLVDEEDDLIPVADPQPRNQPDKEGYLCLN